ncbi:hypothetical protein ABGB18_35580 [Nonomuraea sp. B12E4]|uniref:hypothetical protein n=1 Tax=Nonomuraea sp. B12E4 TaxID=3153564 RepID=UPI00325F8195
MAALLSELQRAPRTAGELSVALKERGFDVSEAEVAAGRRLIDRVTRYDAVRSE